jgi:hypothetical protein
MKRNEQLALITLLGGFGVLAVLIGLFTGLYGLMHGVVIAMAIWVVTGSLAVLWGIKK